MNKSTNNSTRHSIEVDKKANKIMQERYNNLCILSPSPRIPKVSYSKGSGLICRLSVSKG